MKLYIDTSFKDKATYCKYFWLTDEVSFYDPQSSPIDFTLAMVYSVFIFKHDKLILEY